MRSIGTVASRSPRRGRARPKMTTRGKAHPIRKEPFWHYVFDYLADSPGNWYTTEMVAQAFSTTPGHVLPALRAAGRRGLVRWRPADLVLQGEQRVWVDEWRAVNGAKRV